MYVTDQNNERVERFDAAGNYVSQFGSSGSGNGQFNSPDGVAVDPASGDVYVTDQGNARVERFDAAGNYHLAVRHLGLGQRPVQRPVRGCGRPRERRRVRDRPGQRAGGEVRRGGQLRLAVRQLGLGQRQERPVGVAVDPERRRVRDRRGQRAGGEVRRGGQLRLAVRQLGLGHRRVQRSDLGRGRPRRAATCTSPTRTDARVERFDAAGNYISQFGSRARATASSASRPGSRSTPRAATCTSSTSSTKVERSGVGAGTPAWGRSGSRRRRGGGRGGAVVLGGDRRASDVPGRVGPSHGSLWARFDSGASTYTPAAGFFGTDRSRIRAPMTGTPRRCGRLLSVAPPAPSCRPRLPRRARGWRWWCSSTALTRPGRR